MHKEKDVLSKDHKVFIDLFAGCGGFSLGLIQAGWKGLFAIEKDGMAFSTLQHNLINGKYKGFLWPNWLEKEPMPVSRLLNKKYSNHLTKLKNKVDLIVGGPPCQGFSVIGRRNPKDPRNLLTNQYLKIVELVSPRFVLVENVLGFDFGFTCKNDDKCHKSYAKKVERKLVKLGYRVYTDKIKSSMFGVPQNRYRFILLGIKVDDVVLEKIEDESLGKTLNNFRKQFLENKGLSYHRPLTVCNAIWDLKKNNKKLIESKDSIRKGYQQIKYRLPSRLNAYQKLMRKGTVNGETPTDLRLPKHTDDTVAKFEKILVIGEKGKSLSPKLRSKLGMKKQALTPLDPNKPAATVTTLPDDILHYSEPRILTVRENARLQSFPDWFQFKGNYTTGGGLRKKQCPRYTQVGNAIPPLLSEALGSLLLVLDRDSN